MMKKQLRLMAMLAAASIMALTSCEEKKTAAPTHNNHKKKWQNLATALAAPTAGKLKACWQAMK